jgi:hypothetical protein
MLIHMPIPKNGMVYCDTSRYLEKTLPVKHSGSTNSYK